MARNKPDALTLSDDELDLLAFLVDGQIVIDHSSFRGERYRLDDTLFSLHNLESVGHPKIPNWPQIADKLRKRGFLALADRDELQKTISTRAEQTGKTVIHDIGALARSPRIIGAYTSFHGPTREARSVLNELRLRLEELRHRRETVREQGQVVVTKRRESRYSEEYSPGVGRAYRVLRETGNRLYVSPVILDEKTPDLFVEPPERDQSDFYLKGTGPNPYLERGAILAENVTPTQYRRMLAETAVFEFSLCEARQQMKEEIAPIQDRFELRRAQLLANLEDALQAASEPTLGRTGCTQHTNSP